MPSSTAEDKQEMVERGMICNKWPRGGIQFKVTQKRHTKGVGYLLMCFTSAEHCEEPQTLFQASNQKPVQTPTDIKTREQEAQTC